MPEPQPVTLRTVPAYRYREHLLCPTCAQAAILPITEGAEYDDTELICTSQAGGGCRPPAG